MGAPACRRGPPSFCNNGDSTLPSRRAGESPKSRTLSLMELTAQRERARNSSSAERESAVHDPSGGIAVQKARRADFLRCATAASPLFAALLPRGSFPATPTLLPRVLSPFASAGPLAYLRPHPILIFFSAPARLRMHLASRRLCRAQTWCGLSCSHRPAKCGEPGFSLPVPKPCAPFVHSTSPAVPCRALETSSRNDLIRKGEA